MSDILPQINANRNRLPTLFEVLNRQALSPLDLFSFYIYMRDQQRSVDYLDFWLDVAQHLSLCREYVRELRRGVLAETPEKSRSQSIANPDGTGNDIPSSDLVIRNSAEEVPQASQGVDEANSSGIGQEQPVASPKSHPVAEPSTTPSIDPRDQEEQVADFYMRGGGSKSRTRVIQENISVYLRGGSSGSRTRDIEENLFAYLRRTSPESPPRNRPSNERAQRPSSSLFTRQFSIDALSQEESQDAQMSAFLREEGTPVAGTGPALSIPRSENSQIRNISRQDIRGSAEKIFYTYLLPDSEREIALPESIIRDITIAIEEQERDDPEVFDAAKDYVYQAIERDAFPGFLHMKSSGNLVPPTLLILRLFGLGCLFAGFWAAFILIFLDESRRIRLWLILPFTLGVYSLLSCEYGLEPLLAIFQRSEYTLFNFSRIREPYVKKTLRKRAIFLLAMIIIIDAVLLAIFILVPGRRL